MPSNFHPASLNDAALEELRSLESDLGTVAVALQADAPPADLSADQLARLKDTEQRLGVVIVAYDRV